MNPQDTNPPANLDRFREFAQKRGADVQRHYDWGGEYADEDGKIQYSEPHWETLLVKEKVVGERLFAQITYLSENALAWAWQEQWEMQIQLLEAGLERTIEEHASTL